MAIRNRWRLLLAVLLAVAACGGQSSGDSTAETSAPDEIEAAAEASTAAAQPTTTSTATSVPSTSEGSESPPAARPESLPATGNLTVHFLDVGQGDATLLVGEGAAILIDTGRHDRSDLVPALSSLGVTHLDLVIITHAHADHIGQLHRVLDQIPVDEVWMSGTPHTTRTFERAVDALEGSDAAYAEPRSGDYADIGGIRIEVLNPVRLSGDLHDDGLVVRVVHGGVRFLFTGDAEADTEAAIVNRHSTGVAAEILQVGHHGSRTSSTTYFLGVVQPVVAVYSAGADNSYGHPHPEAIERLEASGSEIYGTAIHGRVTIHSDGMSWSVTTGRAAPVATGSPTTTQPRAPPTTTAPHPPPPSSGGGCVAGQVDINSASFEDLQRIIHVGPERATQIQNLRPFSSVDALTRVNGIAEARLRDIKHQGVACVG